MMDETFFGTISSEAASLVTTKQEPLDHKSHKK